MSTSTRYRLALASVISAILMASHWLDSAVELFRFQISNM